MTTIFTGMRIIEWSESIAGASCAKLFADLGADVIKVEPPDGDPFRSRGPFPQDQPHPEASGLFHALNTNKRGVTLDLSVAEDAARFGQLLAGADLLIEDHCPGTLAAAGFGPEQCRAINPALTITSITPFGQTGPYAQFKATDLVLFQMTGIGYITPDAIEHPEQEPPLRVAADQVGLIAAIAAAVATMEALFARKRDGVSRHVDVSAQEAVAIFGGNNVSTYSYTGKVPSRLKAARRAGAAVVVLPCLNGHITLVTLEERQWQSWLDLMGRPDWSDNPLFADRFARAEHWDALEPLVIEWTRRHTKEDIVRWAQERRVPALQVNAIDDVFHLPQLAARGFFVPLGVPALPDLKIPAAPYQYARTPWSLRRTAPTLGQHNAEVFGAAPAGGPARQPQTAAV